MDLYHVDIRLPEGFRLPDRRILLKWTYHAMQARDNDRYGPLPHIPIINPSHFQPVEVGIEDGKVRKVVMRGELTDDIDIVFVLIPHQPSRDQWTVKTVWANERTDSHRTLDRSRYVV